MALLRKLDSHFVGSEAVNEWSAVREYLPMAIAEFDALGAYVGCNLSMQGLTGLTENEMPAFFTEQISGLKLTPSLNDVLSEAMGKKTRKTFQVALESNEGANRLLMGVIFPHLSTKDTITGHLLALIDVTSERDLRNEVRFQSSLLSNLLSHTEDIVLEFCRAPGASLMRGHVPLEWNWSGSELENAFENLRARIHPLDGGIFDQALISLSNEKSPTQKIACRLEMGGGEYAAFDVTFSKLHPKPLRSFLIVFKRQENLPLTKKVDKSAAEEGADQVSRFIAHEMKNMLLLIQLEARRGIDVMERENQNPERALKALKSIYRANEKITALVKTLEDFSYHNEVLDKEWLNLKSLLEDFIHFIGKYLRMSDGKVLLECSEKIKLNTNSILLQIVLMNLFKNAMEAMDGSERKLIQIKAFDQNGETIIRFQDSGPGIKPDVAGKIFEAGVSSKGCGRGTGLFLCSLILKKMGGELKLISDRPTCFEIKIPNV